MPYPAAHHGALLQLFADAILPAQFFTDGVAASSANAWRISFSRRWLDIAWIPDAVPPAWHFSAGQYPRRFRVFDLPHHGLKKLAAGHFRISFVVSPIGLSPSSAVSAASFHASVAGYGLPARRSSRNVQTGTGEFHLIRQASVFNQWLISSRMRACGIALSRSISCTFYVRFPAVNPLLKPGPVFSVHHASCHARGRGRLTPAMRAGLPPHPDHGRSALRHKSRAVFHGDQLLFCQPVNLAANHIRETLCPYASRQS